MCKDSKWSNTESPYTVLKLQCPTPLLIQGARTSGTEGPTKAFLKGPPKGPNLQLSNQLSSVGSPSLIALHTCNVLRASEIYTPGLDYPPAKSILTSSAAYSTLLLGCLISMSNWTWTLLFLRHSHLRPTIISSITKFMFYAKSNHSSPTPPRLSWPSSSLAWLLLQ